MSANGEVATSGSCFRKLRRRSKQIRGQRWTTCLSARTCCLGRAWRSRTPGPRLRRPDEAHPGSSKASQPLATTRDAAGLDSRQSQAFASFTEDSADRLRTLLTVKEVAAYLHVSTETVYRLCALGELRHIRVLNAIRMASSDVDHWYSP